jgi:hypothetical protein
MNHLNLAQIAAFNLITGGSSMTPVPAPKPSPSFLAYLKKAAA